MSSDKPPPDSAPASDSASEAFRAAHARAYAEGPPRQVPGFAALHRMASLLLAERVPAQGRLLVLGAGGGLEIKALAEDHAGWSFDGVDPSAEMLQAAEDLLGPLNARTRLIHGYVDSAPEGPFDGGICLLTLHFVPRAQRLETLRAIRRRLKPGAPFVVAHLSFPQGEAEKSLWIARHLAFAGVDPAKAETSAQAMATRLSVLSPEEDEAMLREAGFSGVALFYAGLTFRGWAGYAES